MMFQVLLEAQKGYQVDEAQMYHQALPSLICFPLWPVRSQKVKDIKRKARGKQLKLLTDIKKPENPST